MYVRDSRGRFKQVRTIRSSKKLHDYSELSDDESVNKNIYLSLNIYVPIKFFT